MEKAIFLLTIALTVTVQYVSSACDENKICIYKCGMTDGNVMNVTVHEVENIENQTIIKALQSAGQAEELQCRNGFATINSPWGIYQKADLMVKKHELTHVHVDLYVDLKYDAYCFTLEADKLVAKSCQESVDILAQGWNNFLALFIKSFDEFVALIANRFFGGSKVLAYILFGAVGFVVLVLLVLAIVGMCMCCCKRRKNKETANEESKA